MRFAFVIITENIQESFVHVIQLVENKKEHVQS